MPQEHQFGANIYVLDIYVQRRKVMLENKGIIYGFVCLYFRTLVYNLEAEHTGKELRV